MTWDAFHSRGEVLRRVVDEANRRRDGVLPMHLPGVAEAFGDPGAVVSALQMRWHTRLSGQIERALMDQPMDLESAVLTAWRRTAYELIGVRAILDACTAEPASAEMGEALERANRKDRVLMAAMAGRASGADAGAARVGRSLEEKARAAYDPAAAPLARPVAAHEARSTSLLDRIKAHLAA